MPPDLVLAQIDRIVVSPPFAQSPQLCRFLRFVAEQEIKGNGDQLKEYALGVEVFRKEESFDPRLDTVVRTEARRLRNKLAEYYGAAGKDDSIEVELPKGGYRPAFRMKPEAIPASAEHPTRALNPRIAAAAAAVLAIAGAAVFLIATRPKDPASVRLPSIAVLPLENLSPDPEQEYFSDGITDELITDLAKIRALRVISRTSVLPYKRVRKPLAEIAGQLGVDYIVEGTISRSADRVRITAQLIAIRNERHLWAESYERSRSDALALQAEVASAIARQINITITPQEQARLASSQVNAEAAENYLKGRFRWHTRDQEQVRKSLDYFNEAIKLEPRYALAYAGLGDAYQVLAARPGHADLLDQARVAARKAIELDNNLGEAHACLGGIYVADWEWERAASEFRKAIELSPSYPTAHYWYGDLLDDLGRTDEGLVEARKAVELDPLSPSANVFLGTALFNARQFEAAIQQLQQTTEAFSRNPVAYIYLGLSYSGKGMHREAIAAAGKAVELTGGDPDLTGLLGYFHAMAGNKSETRRLLDTLNKDKVASPFILAGLYMDLGDKDRALDWLDKGVAQHSHLMELVKITPVFTGLHGDARFTALLKEMKLLP